MTSSLNASVVSAVRLVGIPNPRLLKPTGLNLMNRGNIGSRNDGLYRVSGESQTALLGCDRFSFVGNHMIPNPQAHSGNR